jgi:UDP-glucose 4-epimerase
MRKGMKDTRVLVTGGSGFIGSHLVRRLLAEGCHVAVVVRYSNAMHNERLRGVYDSLHVIEADIRNRGALAAIKGFAPEIIFHLAAYNHVGDSFGQVEECFDVNAKGTANVFDMSGGARKFIYLSTSEVYGHQTSVPFVETATPEPISPYAITKYAGELYCRLKQRTEQQTSTVVLRPFNAYGPYQGSKAVIPELITACLLGRPIRTTPGEQTREFNFVEDLVEGMILAAKCEQRIEGAINLGAGEEIKIRDLVRMIADLTKTTSKVEIGALPYRPTEVWRMYCDSSRARELLGWSPRVGMAQGLKATIEWYRTFLRERGELPAS